MPLRVHTVSAREEAHCPVGSLQDQEPARAIVERTICSGAGVNGSRVSILSDKTA